MLSVIIATQDDDVALVRTLASLVHASMSGVVADVVVADAGSRDDTHQVADAGGCEFLVSDAPRGSRLIAAARHARCRWLMFLTPGVVLEQGWSEEASDFLRQNWGAGEAATRTATFRPARSSAVRPGWRDVWLRLRQNALAQPLVRPLPQQGLIISKAHYLAIGGHRADESRPEFDLFARLGRGACVTLNAKVFAPDF